MLFRDTTISVGVILGKLLVPIIAKGKTIKNREDPPKWGYLATFGKYGGIVEMSSK